MTDEFVCTVESIDHLAVLQFEGQAKRYLAKKQELHLHIVAVKNVR